MGSAARLVLDPEPLSSESDIVENYASWLQKSSNLDAAGHAPSPEDRTAAATLRGFLHMWLEGVGYSPSLIWHVCFERQWKWVFRGLGPRL